jgi:hypothetical protein
VVGEGVAHGDTLGIEDALLGQNEDAGFQDVELRVKGCELRDARAGYLTPSQAGRLSTLNPQLSTNNPRSTARGTIH